MSDRTCGPVAAPQLVEAGLSPRSAELYARTARRVEIALEATGSDLANCNAEQLEAATAEWIENAGYARHVLLEALPHIWRVLGRQEPPDLTKTIGRRRFTPRSVKYSALAPDAAGVLEHTALAVGGDRGRMVLLALHTELTEAEMVTLRWEDLDLPGARWWLREPTSRRPVKLTARLCDHLRPAPLSGWAFPGRGATGHAGVHALTNRVRAVAELAGLGHLNPEQLRRSAPPATSSERPLHPAARRRGEASGITIQDLMATGLARKTAYMYARVLDRCAEILAELDTDLATCTKLELVALAECFPNSTSMRARIRAALRRGWEVLERDQIPSLRAIRVPPKPRAHCLALDTDDARRLEQAAWDRADHHGLAILIGLYSGLRRSEIAQLRWEHFLVDASGVIRWVVVHGKADLAAEVPIHPVLAEALAERRQHEGWLFPGRFDGHVTANTIWDWVRKAAVDAGLGPVATHRLRHTALAEANDRSGDLRTVQELARHRRPETTAGYTRVARSRLAKVTGMIDYGREAGGAGPDPAAELPALGYRQIVTALAGTDAAGAWVELGHSLDAAGGWRFELLEEGTPTWTLIDQPALSASARHRPGGPPTFTLFRQGADDEADMWELERPELVAALAASLSAGVPAPPSVRLGPWIEQPFVEWLAGERTEMPKPGRVALTAL